VRAATAEPCIASHELARMIEDSLGPLFVLPAEAEFAIEGTIGARADGPGYEARIAVSDRHGSVLGQRELASDGPSCRTLDPQIVLVIAMAIDPEIALEALPSEFLEQIDSAGDPAAELLAELRAQQPEGAPPAAPVEHTATAGEVAPRAKREPDKPAALTKNSPTGSGPAFSSGLVAARIAVGVGQLPHVGIAAGLAVRLPASSVLSFEAAGVFWLENDASLQMPTARGDAVHFYMAVATLMLCLEPWSGAAARLIACAGAAGDARWTDGSALTRPRDVTRFDGGPALSAELAFVLGGPVVASLGAALHAPLVRERFTYRTPRGDRTLYRPDVLAGWSFVGLGAAF
jgi:hypothetical protein